MDISQSKQIAVKNLIGKKIVDAGMIHNKWYIKIASGELIELTDGQIYE